MIEYYGIIIGCIIMFVILFAIWYLIYLNNRITEQIAYENKISEPCKILHAYGSWGEECKQYLLNKIDKLENRIEELEK